MDLFGRQEIGQRVNDVPFDRTLQVTRSVALVCSFRQQKFPRCTRHSEQELPTRCFEHALLHLAQFDFQYFFQLVSLQRAG